MKGETKNWDCLASSGAMQVLVFRSRVHHCHLRQREAKKHLSNQSQEHVRHKPQWSEHWSKWGPGCWHTCSVIGKEAPRGKSQIPSLSCSRGVLCSVVLAYLSQPARTKTWQGQMACLVQFALWCKIREGSLIRDKGFRVGPSISCFPRACQTGDWQTQYTENYRPLPGLRKGFNWQGTSHQQFMFIISKINLCRLQNHNMKYLPLLTSDLSSIPLSSTVLPFHPHAADEHELQSLWLTKTHTGYRVCSVITACNHGWPQ